MNFLKNIFKYYFRNFNLQMKPLQKLKNFEGKMWFSGFIPDQHLLSHYSYSKSFDILFSNLTINCHFTLQKIQQFKFLNWSIQQTLFPLRSAEKKEILHSNKIVAFSISQSRFFNFTLPFFFIFTSSSNILSAIHTSNSSSYSVY